MNASASLGCELLGEVPAAVVHIDDREIVIRTTNFFTVPIGLSVTLHFPIEPDDDLMVRCVVSGRFDGGLVLQVLEFDTNLPLSLPGTRVLH